MWPIQTLTLLLCLTEEEQLFAHREPQVPECTVIAMVKEDVELLMAYDAFGEQPVDQDLFSCVC